MAEDDEPSWLTPFHILMVQQMVDTGRYAEAVLTASQSYAGCGETGRSPHQRRCVEDTLRMILHHAKLPMTTPPPDSIDQLVAQAVASTPVNPDEPAAAYASRVARTAVEAVLAAGRTAKRG